MLIVCVWPTGWGAIDWGNGYAAIANDSGMPYNFNTSIDMVHSEWHDSLDSPWVSILVTGYRPSTHGLQHDHIKEVLSEVLLLAELPNYIHWFVNPYKLRVWLIFCSKLLESIFWPRAQKCPETTAAGWSLCWEAEQNWRRWEEICFSGVNAIPFSCLLTPRLSCYHCFPCSHF